MIIVFLAGLRNYIDAFESAFICRRLEDSEGVYKTISRSHSRLFQLLIGGVRMESWTSAVRFQQEALPSSTVELRITVPPA